MKRTRILTHAGLAIVLAVILGACTITTSVGGSVEFPFSRSGHVRSFTPTRGEGAYYRIGEFIDFAINTDRPGYVTLSYLDAAGSVGTFARNIPVGAGRSLISGPGAGLGFQVAEPRGPMFIRASFTASRTDEGRITYRGHSGYDGWNSSLSIDLRGHPVMDVVQTWVNVY